MGFQFLQLAMELSLLTTMRRDDICQIRLDQDIVDGQLKKVINKSLSQRGEANAAYLRWSLDEHPLISSIVHRGRELSIKHVRCPYLISHEFDRKVKAEGRTHGYQVIPGFLSQTFKDVRNATGIYTGLTDSATPPTFHEIRSLSSKLMDKVGYDVKDVQELMAHTDEKITEETYQSGHEIKWTDIHLTLDEKQIKEGMR